MSSGPTGGGSKASSTARPRGHALVVCKRSQTISVVDLDQPFSPYLLGNRSSLPLSTHAHSTCPLVLGEDQLDTNGPRIMVSG